MWFSFLERILIGLTFILLLTSLGIFTLYSTKDLQTQYIAKEYNSMFNYLVTECQIDLNQLQKENFETQRCNTMKRLYNSGTLDYNQYLSSDCNTNLAWN